jgi:hypothetical protein
MIKKTHSTRKPSKLETQLRMSIKLAKLEKRLNALEAEVLRLGKRQISHSIEIFGLPAGGGGTGRLDHEMRPEFQ